jgi:hypothetical protein
MYSIKEFGEVDSLRVTVLMEDYAGYESEEATAPITDEGPST